ncbi:GntR family transcriptional regulator [Actinoplanes sp. NBRC 101535]|uniref:GntR family transcriptional regulator n=1 Tax=Actinoplanes sp. NBRC 101535 TaxID=3032196 RepID=UPI0024A4A914|nr:GntR family transcriptional regulator [Actinoplanes sp. NBRC 101535]GLY07123.1 hypothetical protein Acsp01_75020 [Actinoplanes sp. NBRC 101535]
MADRLSFLSAPLPRDQAVPLRVLVHSRVLDGIRSGVLTPGSMIPTETELGQLLGVSRTVVREALMLLDEDGFIVSRRGIGRFVADSLPQIGLERLRPVEELLGVNLELERTAVMLQPTTSTFVAEELGVAADTPTWFVETVIRRDGRPVALAQEHVPAAGPLTEEDTTVPGTLLSVLLRRSGPAISAGVARLTPGVLGEGRAASLGADPAEPVLIVTQTAQLSGKAYYLAKYALRAEAGNLSVIQSGH